MKIAHHFGSTKSTGLLKYNNPYVLFEMSYETTHALEIGLQFAFIDLPDFRKGDHWQYLQLNAYHSSDKEPIGYLRVAFVSPEVGEAINHERLLLVQTKGNGVYKTSSEPNKENIYFHEPLRDSWKKNPRLAARYVMESVMRVSYSRWNDNLKTMSNEELIKWVEDHRPHLNEHTQQALEDMFHFAVNKADVDYISLEEKWQKKGIALAMYESMALFLDQKFGVTLNASTTQSPSAQKCWERLKKQDKTKQAPDGRMFFAGGVSQATLNSRDLFPSRVPLCPAKPRPLKKKP